MDWAASPFFWLSAINILSGMFSSGLGLLTALGEKTPFPDFHRLQAGNPWIYVIGGLLTALIGVGNAFRLTISTWATLGFVLTSLNDAWLGEGRKDFRFFTLNAYAFVQTLLVVWTTQFKSIVEFP